LEVDVVRVFKIGLAVVTLLAWSGTAEAVPLLQLDIIGGVYDEATQTIVSQGPSFQLVAVLSPGGSKGNNPNQADDTSVADLLANTYYISAAMTPQVGPAGTTSGSFAFNGSTVNATGGMDYGIPPLDDYDANNDAHLAPHDIFPTYFSEFSFQFDAANRTTRYNTELDAGQGPIANSLGTSYYQLFTVDTGGLDAPFQLHFDLYDIEVRRQAQCRRNQACTPEDLDAGKFAPFSHDAESGEGPPPVPEPATLLLTLGGIAAVARLRARKSPHTVA
jgi:hypothetical protein